MAIMDGQGLNVSKSGRMDGGMSLRCPHGDTESLSSGRSLFDNYM